MGPVTHSQGVCKISLGHYNFHKFENAKSGWNRTIQSLKKVFIIRYLLKVFTV